MNVDGVFYVNCTSGVGIKQKECESIDEAYSYYEQCKKENEWNHIELTKQVKVYFSNSDEEFIMKG